MFERRRPGDGRNVIASCKLHVGDALRDKLYRYTLLTSRRSGLTDMPPRRIENGDSDSDLDIFEDFDSGAKSKGKGKGKAIDRGKKDKGKGKAKEVREAPAYIIVQAQLSYLGCSNHMPGRRPIRGRGIPSKRTRLEACKAQLRTS